MLKKQDLTKLTLILNALNIKLTNDRLHDYIFDKVTDLLEGKSQILENLDTQIKIKNKQNNDTFKITFIPTITGFDKLLTEYTCWNNHYKELKEIIYDGNKIIVNETEIAMYIGQNDEINSIEKKITKQEYLNNQLIYKYSFESRTSTNINTQLDGSTEKKMYILPDKSAVQMISCTGEKDYFGSKSLNYYITDYCNEPDFNTREQDNHVYTYGFTNTTKEEYQNFVIDWEIKYNPITNKKYTKN